VPLDLAGMGSERLGGLGDLPHRELHRIEAGYRFFFNPIRYTSLPLAVLEAMAIGLPIVALATTELPRAVRHRVDGFVSNDLDELVDGMKQLIWDPGLAQQMSANARDAARELYGIERFRRDWNAAFARVLDGRI
jgi:glycosyltransferase involved in cell wall biosynthesis